MNMDEITQASLLYDFYGQLLPKRQKQVMELYHEENLSLSEIAAEFQISRQGVHDALKNAERSLEEYEGKLGLVSKFQTSRNAIGKIDQIMETVIARLQQAAEGDVFGDAAVSESIAALREAKVIIDQLEE